MTPIEVKIYLLQNGLTLAGIAREMMDDFPDAKEESVRSMLTQTVNQKCWYPKVARAVNKRYAKKGLKLVRPSFLAPLETRRAA